jgi:signal transduction histidine kinase
VDQSGNGLRADLPVAEARVLGRLMAAQNVLPVLPTPARVAEFYADALASIPGVSATRVCLAQASSEAGAPRSGRFPCAGCEWLPAEPGGATLPAGSSCRLTLDPAVRVVPLRTANARYGFFVVQLADDEEYERYAPFVANIGSFLALWLENGVQQDTLRGARDALERTVAQLRDRTVQLEAANNELEAFAYSVSHDLRAPLRHISAFTEMLREGAGRQLDEPSRHQLDAISGSAGRMRQLIDDLLSFSRMGRAELSRRPVDLDALVRDVVRELQEEAAGRVVRWRVDPLPVVEGDRAMLRVALVNLLGNALKFTRPRPVAEIDIGAEDGAGEVVVFVRDNGIGFDMAHAERLFGVFERLPHPGATFEGTGIGLATVRRIVQRHGGRTWARAAVDHGATFSFSLPRTPPSPGRAEGTRSAVAADAPGPADQGVVGTAPPPAGEVSAAQ